VAGCVVEVEAQRSVVAGGAASGAAGVFVAWAPREAGGSLPQVFQMTLL
jgi:hypothetical protein